MSSTGAECGVVSLMSRITVFTVIFVALGQGGLRADMMPVRAPATAPLARVAVYRTADGLGGADSGASAFLGDEDLRTSSLLLLRDDAPVAGNLCARRFGWLSDVAEDAEPDEGDPAGAIILTEGHSSFDLCLYALMGLGLCRSAPWVRRLHLGHIPDWYHSGAPQQIGHSHLLGPDALCDAAVCFVQADAAPESLPVRCRAGTVPSLARRSQSIPAVLAARAPPRPTCASSVAYQMDDSWANR